MIQLCESAWLYGGDCLDVLDTFPENSVDAIVTDPPYELKFMAEHWDGTGIAFRPETWAKIMRVLKPGGHLVAFAAPKCQHRMICAIEDAGFEIRDCLMWIFGTGFPKSLDVSKAIDKAAGAKRVRIGRKDELGVIHGQGDARNTKHKGWSRPWMDDPDAEANFVTAPATDEAREWEGFGTALKPAYEPICLARKPLSEGTVAANVLKWGTGAINIGGCRIETSDGYVENAVTQGINTAKTSYVPAVERRKFKPAKNGRWPANVCHDGSEEVVDIFPKSKGQQGDVRGTEPSRTGDENTNCCGEFGRVPFNKRNDSGSAARFFYTAKASAKDRCDSLHPTVKPISLMQWLVRMVTPPGGTVLDPFAGTGTTGQAAINEGFQAVLIEREEEYRDDIMRRLMPETQPTKIRLG